MKRRARLATLVYGVAAAAYLVDRVSKWLVVSRLARRPPVEVIHGVLQLNYTQNSGGAFGLGGSASWLFAGATIAVSIAIVVLSARVHRSAVAVGMGLVLGGGLGNLTDRVIRGEGFSGRVVDFIDLRVWPVFNVADACIVVGALLILFSSARRSDRP
ncbi:MAG: signal peptidase II [Actinomycetota bacterium]|nr:signal peptidase II [Actinomycetota bacterium]